MFFAASTHLLHHTASCPLYLTTYRLRLRVNTLIARVDPLCDEQAAGLWFGCIRIPDGELVGREAKGEVAHLAALCPVGADSAEHGLLLCAVDWWRC